MKKSLLFLFLLVLGVTQGWAVDYLPLPASGNNPDDRTVASRTLVAGGTYRVETNTTIDGTQNNVYGLRVPENSTVTIYIAKGKTLLVRGENASTGTASNRRTNPGKPAIEVPSTSTLIITGGGTLRVYGGKAASRYNNTTTTGSAGAAPAIGGIGGNGGADKGDGSVGTDMGTVYVRGNVTVRAARGTSYGRRATSSRGADGAVPTYAIGGGGGGGAGRKGTGVNGATGDNGELYIEKSARVIYLNGRRDTRNRTVASFKTPTKLNVQYIVDGALKTTQELKEFGTLNVKNEAYSVTTEDETLNDDGFTTVTVKNVKSWNTKEDGSGDTYNTKDLLVYNNVDRTGASVDFPLYAQWDENSGVQFNGIHDAYELTQFANVVNAGKAKANGILMADINMAESAWTSTTVARDGKTWGTWGNWVPIGGISDQELSADGTKAFKGIFDGNGYIVSNLVMSKPENWSAGCGRAGLIGYAKGATIKNVVVKNATLWGKWNVAAVCGRLDLDGTGSNAIGSISNCGSFGTLNLNHVSIAEFTDRQANDLALNVRVAAGVAVMLGVSDPTCINSVWSTYDQFVNTTYTNSNRAIMYNNVIGASGTNNGTYNGYTQNSETNGTKKTWVYVPSDKSEWLSNGKLCLDLNGNVDGATTWTQTFNNSDDKDPCSYNECPRPTNRGLAVYSENTNYNSIYTITFDSNGGTECADEHVKRYYPGTGDFVYPSSLPTSTMDGYEFNNWWNALEGGTQVAAADLNSTTVKSDITLYAHWTELPTYIYVDANKDPNVKKDGTYDYYCTFYYGEQDYRIITENVVAYKAVRGAESNNLVMKTLQDQKGNVSKVIPAGEAVILKAKTAEIQLQAVQFNENIDPEPDSENALYGSDEEIAVADVRDNIPSSVDDSETTYGNCFVFSCVNNKLGFYLPQLETLAAHKAYVLLDDVIYVSGSSARPVYMLFDDELAEDVTGISEFRSDAESKKAIFSINGMPLSKLQKGINIVGGKKVFVK